MKEGKDWRHMKEGEREREGERGREGEGEDAIHYLCYLIRIAP